MASAGLGYRLMGVPGESVEDEALRALVPGRADAEGVVQEAFTTLARWPDVSASSGALPWLLTVVRNACVRPSREMVLMRDIEGLSGEKTAQRLGLSMAAMKAVFTGPGWPCGRTCLQTDLRERAKHPARGGVRVSL